MTSNHFSLKTKAIAALTVFGLIALISMPAFAALPTSKNLKVHAAGRPQGSTNPIMEVWVKGSLVIRERVKGSAANRVFQVYNYTAPAPFDVTDVVIKVHDAGGSSDLRVDKVIVGDTVYQTEAATTFSSGTWTGQVGGVPGCAPWGNYRTEWLHCSDGIFMFAPPDDDGSPSGEAMPLGDLPGWQQIFAEDFKSDVALGEFPGNAYYQTRFDLYADGSPDTAGKRGAPSRYYPSKVLSVSDGILRKYLHTENGTPMAAALLPIIPGNSSAYDGQLYGKYTARIRAEPLRGFKTAWLLWPDSDDWPDDGEIDFPEGDLSGTMQAFMHRQDGEDSGDQDAFQTDVSYEDWHTVSIEWMPGRLDFILDGVLIGRSTQRIPNTPMHWVLQTESCLDTCPDFAAAGDLEVDWVVMYSPR